MSQTIEEECVVLLVSEALTLIDDSPESVALGEFRWSIVDMIDDSTCLN